MFTGIIEEIGIVEDVLSSADKYTLKIRAKEVLEDTKIGDSICTNGVCLTVKDLSSEFFYADVMNETIDKSNLGKLEKKSKVNLERALTLNTRLGGHIVTGHIDSVGRILDKSREGNSVWFTIESDAEILKYIIYKGSVALDGISLTIAEVDSNSFKVSIIPHTENETTLLNKSIGDEINIECDVLGKYVEKLLNLKNINKEKSKIDSKFLMENGFI